jgi:uncharacterized repeat protein (TIGR02543 family)
MTRLKGVLALFAAALVVVLAACPNSSGSEEPEQYTLAFESHGGSPVAAIRAAGEAVVAKPTDPAWNGYDFTGWFSAETGDAECVIWPYTLRADLTMHAQWAAIGYTITYDLDGGNNARENPEVYTIENLPITLAAPAKTGYTFGGWFENSGLTGEAASVIDTGGNKTFYARWTIDTGHQSINLAIDDFADPADSAFSNSTFTLTKPNGTKTISISGSDNDTSAQWRVGPTLIHTGSSVTLSAANLSPGTHALWVTAEYDGERYSKELTFRVEK